MIVISWPFSGLLVIGFLIVIILVACMSYKLGELKEENRKMRFTINVINDGDKHSKYIGGL